MKRLSTQSLLTSILCLVASLVLPGPLDRLLVGLLGLGFAGVSHAAYRVEQTDAALADAVERERARYTRGSCRSRR